MSAKNFPSVRSGCVPPVRRRLPSASSFWESSSRSSFWTSRRPMSALARWALSPQASRGCPQSRAATCVWCPERCHRGQEPSVRSPRGVHVIGVSDGATVCSGGRFSGRPIARQHVRRPIGRRAGEGPCPLGVPAECRSTPCLARPGVEPPAVASGALAVAGLAVATMVNAWSRRHGHGSPLRDNPGCGRTGGRDGRLPACGELVWSV